MPPRHGNRTNKQFGLSKAARDSFSGITSMFPGQLSTPARIRLFLQKCLDDPRFFDLKPSHLDSIATDTDVLPKLQNGSYDDIRFVLHSRCKKVAWYWVHSRFLISQGIYSLLASEGVTRETLPQIKILDFNKFIRCTNPQPTPDLEQRILNSILAGSRYDFLCRTEEPSGDCLVHEGLLFLLPHFVTAPQWEKEFGTVHLDAIRRHLHYLDIKPIADSYQGESGSLQDLVRRIIDHYINSIESSYGLQGLWNTAVDPTNDQLEVKHETATPVQSSIKSLENPSSTEEIEYEAFESDAQAAEAQLQQELSEAISYEEQVASDIKGLIQLMESEASEHDAVAAEDRDLDSIIQTTADHEGLVRDGTATALDLKLTEDGKPMGLKRRYSLTALLNLRESVWEQTQAKEIIQDDERPSKSPKHSAYSPSASGHQIKHEDYINPSEQQPSWPILPSSNVQQTHHHHQYITQSSLVDANTTPLPDPARSPDTLHIQRHHSVPNIQGNGSTVPHLDRPASDSQPKAALPPQRDYYQRSLTSPSSKRRNIRYFDRQPPPPAWETETSFPNHITQTPHTVAGPAAFLESKLSYTNLTMQTPLATTSPSTFLEP